MPLLLVLLLHRHASRERARRKRARRIAALFVIRSRLRARNCLVSAALGDPNNGSWQAIYRSNHEGSFITATSLTQRAFEDLLAEFSKHYEVKSGPGRRGRPPKASHKSTVLGLLLCFYTGTADSQSLCMSFALPPSTFRRLLAKAEIALHHTLRNLADARIAWPSFEQQREWGDLVNMKESLLANKFGFVDGKNYDVQSPSDIDEQNCMYNGWLHAALITGVLCFAPDGCIIWMKHNCPGSWNDGENCRDLCKRLLDEGKTLREYGIVADTAFAASNNMFGKIVTPTK
ncbi:hypothetical protein HDU98_004292, partial [Podochytrium sp. JEL0797]